MEQTADNRKWPLPAATLAVVIAAMAWVVLRVDLTPRVESDFFFSTDNPQLQASQRVAELFPSSGKFLITASSEDVLAEDYIERLEALSDELDGLDGIAGVQSLTRGPSSPRAVPKSPIWSRLLLGSQPGVSLVIATVGSEAEDAEGSSPPELAARVEEIVERRHSPGFALRIS